ncbi:hypothetical protein EDC56_0039 [Sinobacterium caligoides]|uniref:Beta-barrel porin 2 n=1 Tax=Sinobacterium caligoides TaxID=933926 RepID=A0A3N2E2H3_9GAMM|nr:hypothetical protein [Sinobacterium caligoides]ROS06132.1 hypothetical protein EDC56_0039 [Sinobacterium caligoides]
MSWVCIKRLSTLSFCLPIIMLLFSSCSIAAERLFTSSVELSTDNDSNARMSVDSENKVALQGYSLSPRLAYSWDDEVFRLEAKGRLEFERFDNDDYNSNNADINLASNYIYDDTTELGVTGGFTRLPTRVTELTEAGKIDTGDVEQWNLDTNIEKVLTERQYVSLRLGVSQLDYSSEANVDRKSATVNGQWRYMLSERWTVSLLPSYSIVDYVSEQFDPNELESIYSRFQYALRGYGRRVDSSSNISIPVQLSYQYSELIRLSGYVGVGYLSQKYEKIRCIDEFMLSYSCAVMSPKSSVEISGFEDSSKVVGFDVDYKHAENSSFSLSASIQNLPSSNGYLEQSSSIKVSYSSRVSDNSTLYLVGKYGENKRVDVDVEGDGREYYLGAISYYYRFNESWRGSLKYNYKKNKTESGGVANGQVWGLGVTYSPSNYIF